MSDNQVFPKITSAVTAEMYLAEHGSIIIPLIDHQFNSISGLDMTGLLPEIKEYIVKWLIEVNRRRLNTGLPLVVTYEILKVCPIWKNIGGMPYRRYNLSQPKGKIQKSMQKNK